MKRYFGRKMLVIFIGLFLVAAFTAAALVNAADLGRERLIRELRFVAYTPGTNKELSETHKYIAERIKKLGLQIDFRPMQRQGVLQNMWYSRNYDLGTLYLTGRPTRVDPHMILSKMYHSFSSNGEE